jgi:hypothetical protein
MLWFGRFTILQRVYRRSKARTSAPVTPKRLLKKKCITKSPQMEEEEVRKSNAIQKQLSEALNISISEIKPTIEAHMTEKCQTRKMAEKTFKRDIRNLAMYSAFLIMFSISASSTDSKTALNVRQMVEPAIFNFASVVSIGEC